MVHTCTKCKDLEVSGQLEFGPAIYSRPMGVTLFKIQTEGGKKGITAGKLS